MIIVFVTITIIHLVTLKIYKLPKATKDNFRKKFFYFYGLYFFVYGVSLIIQNGFDPIGIGFVAIAIFVLYLNYNEKIDSPWNEIFKKPWLKYNQGFFLKRGTSRNKTIKYFLDYHVVTKNMVHIVYHIFFIMVLIVYHLTPCVPLLYLYD